MNKVFFNILFFSILLIAVGCDRVTEDLAGDEMARFNAWIQVNKIPESCKTSSGLYYISEREGTGLSPKDSNIVVYKYVVRNLDDYIFNNTYKDTAKLYDIYGLYSKTTHYTPIVAQFLPKERPQALFESLSLMKEGGKARFIAPSSLAYGSSGFNTIPSYTSLIGDIELVEVFDGTIIEYEQKIIDKYVDANPTYINLDTVYYKNVWSGTGSVINKDSIVKVNYIGRFLDGVIFDTNIKSVAIDSNIYNSSNKYTSLEFKVGSTSADNNVGVNNAPPLKGFQFAVKQMKEGDTADFVIPSKYMYGISGTTNIPAYTPLRFRIIVVDVRVKP